LVGFSPRLNGIDPVSGESIYFKWQHTWWTGAYSIMLTKAAFLHKKYLTAYENVIRYCFGIQVFLSELKTFYASFIENACRSYQRNR
jgi:hypothetical protein